MDFHSILSIAHQKQQVAEKKKSQPWGLSTKFAAPKKEQRTKEKKSEAVRKLLEEKEREKRNKEKAERNKAKELKKAQQFRIPKAGEKSSKGSSGNTQDGTGSKVKEEEVAIHKEDFVKSSSRKRMAHNPVFSRPPITPVKEEAEPTKSRSKSSSDISAKPSGGQPSHKHSSSSRSSKSGSSLSSPSVDSSKSSSKSQHSTSSSDKLPHAHNGHKHSKNGHNSSLLQGKTLATAANQYKGTNPDTGTKPTPKPKTKMRPAPPPMQFDALLKLAEQKHKEPVKADMPKKIVKQEDSLRTQEEIDRLERMKSKSYQEWLKFGSSKTSPEDVKRKTDKNVKKNPEPASRRDGTDIRKPKGDACKSDSEGRKSEAVKRKLISDNRRAEVPSKVAKQDSNKGAPNRNSNSIYSKVNLKEKFRTKSAGNSSVPNRPPDSKLQQKPSLSQRNQCQSALQRTKSESGLDRRKGPVVTDRGKLPTKPQGKKAPSYASTHENVLVCGPPKKEEPTKSQNPWDRIYGQIQKNRPVQAKRRIEDELDSEEEEWSSEDDFIDDDFIDDGPVGAEDVSSHLKEVFGYSYRDRFRDFDDRDTNMVSSFAQQMKEEARSTRLGKLEDLEDMRKEEEELRRKKLAKKKKLKAR